MPRVFHYHHTVAGSEIDGLHHASNVAYVDWMQAAAIAHSDAQGWDANRYLRIGYGWVVRSHKIEYLQPAFEGEAIDVETWVATMKKVSSLRRFRIWRCSDHALLAKAETLWAFVSYESRQPKRILPEIAEAFEIVEGEP